VATITATHPAVLKAGEEGAQAGGCNPAQLLFNRAIVLRLFRQRMIVLGIGHI
jgi:hypothetical protein